MTNFAVIAKISADVSGFVEGMKKAKESVGEFETKTSNLKNLGNTISGVGGGLTKGITVPALTAASALSGITLKKGFDRLMGIDTARAKLTGLGHDAESVDTIMDNALESVKGTAFGLDKAATSAANAVAAGVEPGKELTKYLKMTGDAAAIAGTDIDEMGSIMNKVKAGGAAYTGELNQLADRGLPIWKMLADEMGVTETAVRNLASEGEISSETLFNAIENNIGGAAQKMGELSTAAAWDNMLAAMGRVGAAFLGAGDDAESFFDALRPLFNNMIGFFDKLAPAAEKMGKKFGNAFKKVIDWVGKAYNWFTKLSPSMQKLIGVIAAIAIAAGPFLMVVGKIITLITPAVALIGKIFGVLIKLAPLFKALGVAIAFLTSPIGLVIVSVTALVAAFIYLWNTSESFRDSVISAWENIKTSISKAIDFIVPFAIDSWNSLKEVTVAVFTSVVEFVQNAWGAFSEWWSVTMQKIQVVATVVWDIVKNAITTAIESIMGFLEPFITFLTDMFTPTWELIKTTAIAAWEGIQLMIEQGSALITGILTALGMLLTGDFAGAWEMIKTTVINVWESIKGWISETVTNIWDRLVTWFSDLKTSFSNNFSELLDTVIQWTIDTYDKIKTWVSDWVAKIVEWGGDFLSKAQTGFSNVMSEIMTWISNTIANIGTWVSDWIGEITSWASDFLKNVKTSFTNVKTEVTNWISDTISNVKRWAMDWAIEIAAWGLKFVSKIAEGVADAISEIKGWVNKSITRITNWGPLFISEIRTWMTKFADRIKDGAIDALTELAQGISNMVTAAGQFVGDFVEAGKELIRGMIRGIKNMASDLVKSARGVVSDAVQGAKNLLGIKSPSRVFRDIGQDTIMGMILGVGDEKRDAVKSITGIASDMSKAFRPDLNTGINGSMLPSAQMNSTIKHELSSHEKQPMNLNVRIGNHDYKLFVEDITQSQQNQAVLERY